MERVRRLFLALRHRPVSERAAFLSGEDLAVRGMVEVLLGHADEALDESESDSHAAPATADDALVGTTLAGWHLEEVLGEGGSGKVYRAVRERDGGHGAFKLLSVRHGRSAAEAFETERAALSRLEHPAIVPLIEAGTVEHDGQTRCFVVTEHVEDAEPLVDGAMRDGLDFEDRIALLAEVADAVGHAHARGVVHRDLKPGNILLDGERRPRIVDFGIALLEAGVRSHRGTDPDRGTSRARATDRSSTKRHDVGEVPSEARPRGRSDSEGASCSPPEPLLGTLAYLAPEQIDARLGAITPATDVYALGVIAYRLLTGEPPYEVGASMRSAAQAILHVPPVDPAVLRPRLPQAVAKAVLAALSKSPGERPPDASAFAAALRGETTPLQDRQKNRRRTSTRVGAAAAIGLLATVAGAIWMPSIHRSTGVSNAGQTPAESGESLSPGERTMRSWTKIVLGGAAASTAISGALGQEPVQWRVEDGGNGHWYQLVPELLQWGEARDRAVDMGGHLATVTGEGEADFIVLVGEANAWLGASAPLKQGCDAYAWSWVTGEAWSYTNWRPGEPGDCGETGLAFHWNSYDGRWNNQHESVKRSFVVEWSADCNGDGIVDVGQILDGTLVDANGDNVPDCCQGGLGCGVEPIQWRVEDGGNGHWYAAVPCQDEWMGARQDAQAVGADLAVMPNEQIHQFLIDTFPPIEGYWIGGYQDPKAPDHGKPAGGWRWIGGEPIDLPAWCPGQPDNSVGAQHVLRLRFGCFDDIEDVQPCGGLIQASLVEWSADCNGDGIVDYGQILDGTLVDADGDFVPDCCGLAGGCEAEAIQWRIEDGGNGHWYQGVVPNDLVSWHDARSSAEVDGGHLVSITSEEEHDFIFHNLASNPTLWHAHPCGCLAVGPWIGLHRPEKAWTWVTGEAATFFAWHPGEPWEDTNYVRFFTYETPPDPAPFWDNSTDGESPEDEFNRSSYLVEWSADCNGDGLVDYGQILDGTLVDADGNNVPDICECTADLNGNGAVDGADISVMLGFWGENPAPYPAADINADGFVNGSDLAEILGNWGPCQ